MDLHISFWCCWNLPGRGELVWNTCNLIVCQRSAQRKYQRWSGFVYILLMLVKRAWPWGSSVQNMRLDCMPTTSAQYKYQHWSGFVYILLMLLKRAWPWGSSVQNMRLDCMPRHPRNVNTNIEVDLFISFWCCWNVRGHGDLVCKTCDLLVCYGHLRNGFPNVN